MRELSALPTEGETSYATAYLFEIVSLTAQVLLKLHPSAPLGVLLAVVPKVPKNTLFGTPHLETEFPFCGGKRKISASDAATTVSSANLTFQKHQSAIIFKPHSVMAFSQRKLKRTVSLSFSPRISCGGFICSALIFSFVVGFRETSV